MRSTSFLGADNFYFNIKQEIKQETKQEIKQGIKKIILSSYLNEIFCKEFEFFTTTPFF